MELKIKHFVYLVSLLAFTSACTERYEIELDTTYERLVVEGHLTTDTAAHWVKLTRSKDYFSSNEVPTVSNAQVILGDGNSFMELEEYPENPGYYLTPDSYYGIPGTTYSLQIKLEDAIGESDTYSATCELRPVATIDSIQVVYNEDWEIYEVRIFAWEPVTTDWYIFQVLRNGVLLNDTINEFWTSDDRYFNGNYTNGIMVGFLNPEDTAQNPLPGDTITLQMSGITEDYYNFIIQLQDQTFQFRNPLFSGPPANVITNIPGATGFFAAYSKTYASVIYEE